MCCLTDNKGLFEGRPRDVVPWRSASSVDGPFVRPQQRRFRLGLACGAFWWREGRGQRAAGGMACEAVQRIISAPTEVKDSRGTHSYHCQDLQALLTTRTLHG